MNILLVYKEADIATYKMLEGLSKLEDFNIYIASPQSYTDKKIYGNCTPLDLPVITSKFNWNVIRALREIIKTYRIDLIYSPSSSGLSNALFASIGTRAKNIAYRGTQAKLKRFDPTYYLGILNPAVEHVVCETKDIEEYLSRFIARIIRKTKCFDFWERNVLFPKTKRSFFRTPTPLPCPFPLNFSLLIITKKFGNFAKNRYICIV
ncbi:hypothetical protein [Parabacteroides distasonis]|uniref:hypothetical protein n=1 Tax=Parabacteroides distasonis TaxID=823 RepID=UPI0021BDC331